MMPQAVRGESLLIHLTRKFIERSRRIKKEVTNNEENNLLNVDSCDFFDSIACDG